jgi:hypothetical protein
VFDQRVGAGCFLLRMLHRSSGEPMRPSTNPCMEENGVSKRGIR